MLEKINVSSDADSVLFPLATATPDPVSFSEQSVYTCFHPVYLFSLTFFKYLLVSQS